MEAKEGAALTVSGPPRLVALLDLVHCGVQLLESAGEPRRQQLPGLGEHQRALEPAEEARADVVLEPLDLVADGRGGDAELLGGPGEAQMPGGGLEGPQAVERRKHHGNPDPL